MTVATFAFIAWLIISCFGVIPKKLSLLDNFLLFFFIIMMSLSASTIISLNLKLFPHSTKPDLFVSFWFHRYIIIPVSLIGFANLIYLIRGRVAKLAISLLVFVFLLFEDFLTVQLGLRTFNGWNLYLSGMLIAVYMLFTAGTAKALMQLEGK